MLRDLLYEETWRLRLVHALMVVMFSGLTVVLWDMQVRHRERYQSDLMRQSVRRVRIPGRRGRIFDRRGQCLADNRPSYCIAIYLEELRRPGRWDRTIDYVDALITRLGHTLELPRQVTREDIRMHIRKRLPLPFIAWRDTDEIAVARWAELVAREPGVDVQLEPVRAYPYGSTACHLLGYVGRAAPEDLAEETQEPYHYYLPEMAGRSGLERVFDGVLRGEPGGRLVRVDVSGFRFGDIAVRESQSGLSLRLALDVRLQERVEKALEGRRGAAVVVDPRNGDVLALASTPGYDLNAFSPSIGGDLWNQLRDDPAHPLVNRALAGAYAPGSTFKLVVALASLENGKSTPQTVFSCPGYFLLGSARFNCWLTRGHGAVDLQSAIEQSCNVYFFRLGLQCGWDAIYHMAAALGFGQKTDIVADYEVPGLLPNHAWKRRVMKDSWRDGDTCNGSIGQGALLVTPVQMAMYAAALANGGILYRPRVVTDLLNEEGQSVRTFPPVVTRSLGVNPRHLRVVQEGMRRVVMAPQGSGRLARVPNVEVAGKTGTAEYGRKEEGRKIGWMIAYAPFDQPTIALAVMVEDAVSGGATVAPIVRTILESIFPESSERGQG
jgi:penicillin-binding protein 2